MAVGVDLNISLDGFASTTDQTPEEPWGRDWWRLVDAYIATRTIRARVLHDTTGEGTTGVVLCRGRPEIMGAGMFWLPSYPDDPDWRGWWGDEPPFRIPVFVLTHAERWETKPHRRRCSWRRWTRGPRTRRWRKCARR